MSKTRLLSLAMKTVAAAAAVGAIGGCSTTNSEKVLGRCHGSNACKGQSACAGKSHACKGMNSCRGDGHEIKNGKECQEKEGRFEPI